MNNNFSENRHCNCGKKISNKSKHCRSCANSGKNNPGFKKGQTLKINECIDCGGKLNDHVSTRCRKCYYLFAKGANAANIKHGKCCKSKRYYCECGKEMYSYRSNFCKKCSLKGKRHPFYHKKRPDFAKKMTGKNHPNYIPGLNREYPVKFNDVLTTSIRKRDKHKCQACGILQKEHIKINRCKLHVHHIDYDKENCKPKNLITLCIKCNSIANFNRDYWFAYFTYKMEVI